METTHRAGRGEIAGGRVEKRLDQIVKRVRMLSAAGTLAARFGLMRRREGSARVVLQVTGLIDDEH